jgi:glutamate-ammonia-ligase adenylyltransferase
MLILCRYKRRETLRIAYGDIVRQQDIATVTEQISWLAEAICEAAIRWTRSELEQTRGKPLRWDGQPARFAALALGKLGGCELNYSSDIDLVFLCDADGQTSGARRMPNIEFFERLTKSVIRLLTETTKLGSVYRVDIRLRPHGNSGPAVIGAEDALRHYDISGRTWERQAYVKARTVAGDKELGDWFLGELAPWVFRRYLSSADITGIKALKRRIEKRAYTQGVDRRNVKTGHGGIRDIEYVIQFLQLLNGGDLPQLRTGNTLEAIRRLEEVGCLTMQERTVLEANYSFLRNIEHRLQIMFDLQTHVIPESATEMRRLAIRLGYDKEDALTAFRKDLQSKTELNHTILDHLLHDAFPDDEGGNVEADLVLDPEPDEQTIADCLGKYPFGDLRDAYRNLNSLARERVAFLSGRRCRHFLAAIAGDLLREIAATPDPDFTLTNLSNVSESLGGKGILWELFSFNPPSLQLYVQLCATSPYLSGILTSYPGMIDELMDSLLMNSLPSFEFLQGTLAELLKGAEDPVPILHAFKSAQHLRVGVRDLVGRDDVQQTHRALSNIAEVCLAQVAASALDKTIKRYGRPMVEDRECELVILALGKMGGQEPNYHSDLDIVFLYESAGMTQPTQRGRDSTTNQHFFAQLAQRIIKDMTEFGPYGRLFELDSRLRPTGKSGSLALSFEEFKQHFASRAQLWERQSLCKARVVYGSENVTARVTQIVHNAIQTHPWYDGMAMKIVNTRQQLEKTATPTNLKRGRGGTMDIEFIVQMLQLKHASRHADIVVPGTLEAIARLRANKILDETDADDMAQSYRFLRGVEARLRLMNTSKRHDLPKAEQQRKILAFLLGRASAEDLENEVRRVAAENRRRFERLLK